MDTFKKILKWALFACLFAVPFIPLIVVNDMFFPYITGKNFAFRMLIELAFGLWAALAILDRQFRPKRSWLLGAFFIFTFVITIADIFGVNPERSFWSNYERMEGLVTILHLLAYFIILSSALSEKMWRGIVWTSFGVASLIGLFAFNQLAQGTSRPDTTLGNSTYLGGYMLVHVFLVLYFILRKLHASLRQIEDQMAVGMYALLGIFFASVMYITGTRGSVLGFIGGLLVTALILAITEKERLGIRKFSIGLLGVVFLILVALGAVRGTDFAKQHSMIDRFSAFVTLNPNELKSYIETAGFARVTLWQMAWQGVKEHPLLGWGQDNFPYVFAKYYDPKMYTQESWFDRTHNVFFDWLIAGGFLGLISYLSLFGVAVFLLWRKDKFTVTERAVFVGLIVAYFIHNFFVFDNLTSYILIAIVLSFIHIKSGEEIYAFKQDVAVSQFMLYAATVVLVIIPFVVVGVNKDGYFANKDTLLALIYAQSPRISPDTVLQQFQQGLSYNSFGTKEIREQIVSNAPRFMTKDTPTETRIKWYNLAVSETKKQFEADHDARTLIILGGFYAQLGSYPEALSAFTDADKLFPHKPPTLLSIAGVQDASKDVVGAKKTLNDLLTLVPDYGAARAMLAGILIDEGNMTDAKKVIAENATSTYASGNTELIQKLADAGEWNLTADMLKVYVDTHTAQVNYETNTSLVIAYLKSNRRAEALSELEAILTRFPENTATTTQRIEVVKAGGSITK